MKDDLRERFNSLYEIDRNGCWNWIGTIDHRGYGVLSMPRPKRRIKAHRMSWTLHVGPIPSQASYHGTCVLHRCDNPCCVNPCHLFLGTAGDNNRDRAKKGRSHTNGISQIKCRACGKVFKPKGAGTVFCSRHCVWVGRGGAEMNKRIAIERWSTK